MKLFALTSTVLLAAALVPARAAVIYSGLRDIGIAADISGIYLDVDTGITGNNDNSPPPGWDINPFFGGVGVANSPAFQPARIGSGTADAILGLAAGATVDVARLFSTGYGGSQTHLGTQFTAGQEGYLGFRFTTNAPAGPYYGWMRVVFTGNTAGAVIKDWAYENAGSAIVTGRVQQGAASGGAQSVTLSPGSGESFSLGSVVSNTGGNINRVLKTGAGTAALTAANTYTGGTTISGGVLNVGADAALGAAGGAVTISGGATLQAASTVTTSARTLTLGSGGGKIDTNGNAVNLNAGSTVTGTTLTKLGAGTLTLAGTQSYATLTTSAGTTNLQSALGTGNSILNANATTNITVSQTLAALNIGNGAVVTFGTGAASFSASDGDGATLAAVVPEPGAVSLLVIGSLGLLWRRRGWKVDGA